MAAEAYGHSTPRTHVEPSPHPSIILKHCQNLIGQDLAWHGSYDFLRRMLIPVCCNQRRCPAPHSYNSLINSPNPVNLPRDITWQYLYSK